MSRHHRTPPGPAPSFALQLWIIVVILDQHTQIINNDAASYSPGLTIVTPSFEKHAVQFEGMVKSIDSHCLDLQSIELVTVIESKNEILFSQILSRYPRLRSRIVITEEVFSDFHIVEAPASFLSRVGKFTFQSLKKFGGLLSAKSDWSLVLDSETVFHKPFRAIDLLDNYRSRKYVFYTWTPPRGSLWRNSTGYDVTRNCAQALSMNAGDRWYMEYFHWFYETDKVKDLINNCLGLSFFQDLSDVSRGKLDIFENVLYYLYLEKFHSSEYVFLDFKKELDRFLPDSISSRFRLSDLPFSLFGNEYLLNILRPGEVTELDKFFDYYKLPFVRLEPPLFSVDYLPELMKLTTFVATISSHHLMWLRKRIAVCVSGEFRHVVHRTPEQQVRHLLGFLSGVDCDIYLHGWKNTSEALIVDTLKPRAYRFDERPSFVALAKRIAVTEPDIKPRRDEGSLAMLYGIEQAFDLMNENANQYDYVLRIRPDIYSELSLKEILIKISDEGDLLPNTIYFPASFHSKGINDQIALGPVDQMRVYAGTFKYASDNIDSIFFNPETVLLRNLLDHSIDLAIVDIPYALLREVPLKIDTIHDAFHRQFHTWWSRTENLPRFQELSAYFYDKLAAVDAMMRKSISDLVYVSGPVFGNSREGAVIRAKSFENDPSRPASGLFRHLGIWQFDGFSIKDGAICRTAQPGERQLFLFWQDNDLVVSEWRMLDGRLVNNRMLIAPENVAATARGVNVRVSLAFFLQRRREAKARRGGRSGRGFSFLKRG